MNARSRVGTAVGVALTTLTMPFRSHADTDPCVTSLVEAFVVSGGKAPDASCLAKTPPIRFVEAR